MKPKSMTNPRSSNGKRGRKPPPGARSPLGIAAWRSSTAALISKSAVPSARNSAAGTRANGVPVFPEGITVSFPEGTLFPYDSDQLMPAARENMRRFAASLAKYPGTRAMIVGHTDSRGTSVYNADLSERRGQSTANFIAAEGIDRARISTVGRGETEPIATNETEAGRQQNRRVEVAIYADEASRHAGN